MDEKFEPLKSVDTRGSSLNPRMPARDSWEAFFKASFTSDTVIPDLSTIEKTMSTTSPRICLLSAALVLPLPAAASEAGHAAIRDLGSLNGVALACKFGDEVSRMKAAVVDNAPKLRSYGLAFDDATNAAFLSFIERGDPCPSRNRFSEQVDAAIDEVARVFAAP